LKNITNIVEFGGIQVLQVLLTWHMTNSANEWGILNGSLAGVFMILISQVWVSL